MGLSSELRELIEGIDPPDPAVVKRAGIRQARLTKPPGSLGRLEEISVRLAGIFGSTRPVVKGRSLVIAAGDHGVVAQGVTAYPQEITGQMVLNFLAGGAAVTAMTRSLGVDVTVVDAGVKSGLPEHPGLISLRIGAGTADISMGPAMSREQAERCVLEGARIGANVAGSGSGLVATGDMGIGNTTPSSAITAAITGMPPEVTTGRGTGRNAHELKHKTEVVARALAVNDPDTEDPIDVLGKVGGFEIGVLSGVMLGAASRGSAVVIDGFISGAAALIATGLCPASGDYLFAGHRSAEAGHSIVLDHLGLEPILDLDMRLGEGTGAVLAMSIVEAAAACLAEMATFDEAGVSDAEPEKIHGK
ncbi:MAG: nicotinate-nucleotide--dimethylbenzimidazole phosphoribosyltransferase [Dehalococcoidia bacterium]|nr:nicotinate-nucleotide--dimethylbenzimidazole phosphoribosyltransferase [Dehalococcoidia bacterium]